VSSSDIGVSIVSNNMFNYLARYAFYNNQGREDHLRELCRRGAELVKMMESNPSNWTFGRFVETRQGSGPIMVFPPLLRDGELVAGADYSVIG
jgi:hypothetical protein